MAVNSRQKGARGEREIAKILREYGYDARRGQQFKGSPDSPDVVGLPGCHLEIKRVQKLNLSDAMSQAMRDAGIYDMPVVMHRKNREDWKVTMLLSDWMDMYDAWNDRLELGGRHGKEKD